MIPIVRHISNSEAYEFLGGNKWRNLRSGKEGEVSEEKAREVFKFNVEATQIFHEYPLVKELIQKLNMRIEKDIINTVL